MRGLVEQLLENDIIEEDYGPWGALIVLATMAKHREYDWHLSILYRSLNHVTHPFKFPIPRCNDEVSALLHIQVTRF